MILKGNQRGGGKQLARHLLNTQENEHVHIHDMRGFVADDLQSAFHEAYAVSRGTRARQFLFSLSLNPPTNERVSTEDFERAIDSVEDRLGLQNQPRAIVFHEKEGRRHAHAVWSRIDVAHMRAINLSHTKLKLRDVAKALYLEHGWQMPRGLADSKERDPANFSHEEWQQAKRGGHDPHALKSMFHECWAMSDSRGTFAQALKARGYALARGDRRGYVAVDYRGEVYAIAKFTGQTAKALRERLGDAGELPSIAETKQDLAQHMTAMLKRHIEDREAALRVQAAANSARKRAIVQRQRAERKQLDETQEARRVTAAREREQRFAKGLRGLWDRVTGKHARIMRQNEAEVIQAREDDRTEKDRLIFAQLDERKALHLEIRQARQRHAENVAELHRDIAAYQDIAYSDPSKLQKPEERAQSKTETVGQRPRRRDGRHDREL